MIVQELSAAKYKFKPLFDAALDKLCLVAWNRRHLDSLQLAEFPALRRIALAAIRREQRAVHDQIPLLSTTERDRLARDAVWEFQKLTLHDIKDRAKDFLYEDDEVIHGDRHPSRD